MRNYSAFLKKEITEYIRTYRMLILLIVFFIIGVMGPLTAKLMPEILGSFMPKEMITSIPEASAIESWTQFFKNTSQIGFILVIIVFSRGLSREISKGTLINILTKGLSRTTVILAKFTSMVINYTISMLLAFFVTLFYTIYLFGSDGINNLGFAVFCVWLFGVFLLSVLLFGESLIKSSFGGLLFTGLVVVILSIAGLIKGLTSYNPNLLIGANVNILTNTTSISDVIPSIIVSIILTIAFLFGSVLLFRKRQL